jgi:hypothetical protein
MVERYYLRASGHKYNMGGHRGIISELQAINTTWGEAKRKDQDRTRWKETVVALCPPWDEVE